MKLDNFNLYKISLQQATVMVLPIILILDFIIDNELDYVIVIIEILIHSHLAHLISTNILYDRIIALAYMPNNTISIIEIINFSDINIIYNVVVSIICIISVFYFTDHRKLTSRFSTLHFDTLFHHYKEVNKAFIAIP